MASGMPGRVEGSRLPPLGRLVNGRGRSADASRPATPPGARRTTHCPAPAWRRASGASPTAARATASFESKERGAAGRACSWRALIDSDTLEPPMNSSTGARTPATGTEADPRWAALRARDRARPAAGHPWHRLPATRVAGGAGRPDRRDRERRRDRAAHRRPGGDAGRCAGLRRERARGRDPVPPCRAARRRAVGLPLGRRAQAHAAATLRSIRTAGVRGPACRSRGRPSHEGPQPPPSPRSQTHGAGPARQRRVCR